MPTLCYTKGRDFSFTHTKGTGMFQLGNKVIYPGHGVAVIEEIIEKSIGGRIAHLFKLSFLYKDMTVLVPVSQNANTVGLRPLSAGTEIEVALNKLYEVPKKFEASDFSPSCWNKRNKLYQLKLQSGGLVDIATIYRDLMHTSKYKDLSFGEKNMLQMAEDLLVQEIVVVRDSNRTAVIQELRAPFKDLLLAGHVGLHNHPAAAI